MNYSNLIQGAWDNTLKHRWLWVIGLFSGGAVGGFSFGGGANGGSGAQWRMNDSPAGGAAMPWREGDVFPGGMAQVESVGRQMAEWAAANYLLIGSVLVAILVLGLVSLILAPIAQGAMAQATADYAEGRQTSFGQAFRTGLHLFWRYVGLWLLLGVVAIVVAATTAAIAAGLFIGISAVDGAARGVAIGIGILIGIPLLLALLAAGIGASIVVAYAQRAIQHEHLGPFEAIGYGIGLLRGHLRESLLVWLLNILLAIGATIGIGVATAAVAAILAAVGVGLWAAAGATVGISYAVVAVAGLAVIALALVGASNTFFWSYWTLAYLKLVQPSEPTVGTPALA